MLRLFVATCTLVMTCGCRQALGIEELTPAEIPAACAYRDRVLADGPLSYWRLGEREGDAAHDELGSAPGAYVGDVTLGAPGIACEDGAIELHGDDSPGHADMGDVFDFGGTAAFSVELWVMSDGAPQAAQALVFNVGWELALAPEGPLFVREGVALAGAPLAVGAFSHLVATFDGSIVSLYVDGAPTTLADGAEVVEDAGALHIGDGDGREVFAGALDELAIYDEALSEGDVAAHRQAADAE